MSRTTDALFLSIFSVLLVCVTLHEFKLFTMLDIRKTNEHRNVILWSIGVSVFITI